VKESRLQENIKRRLKHKTSRRLLELADALRLLRNQMSPRDALLFIGRYYFRLKLEDMERIFRWDFTHISRIVRKTERKLKIRG
jgi:hypothetical protein